MNSILADDSFSRNNSLSILDKNEDLTTLWSDLDLQGLLASSAKNVNSYAEQARKLRKPKKSFSTGLDENKFKSGYKRLDEIQSSSGFKVLMGRYSAAPKPARFCHPENIKKLADPVVGRYRGIDKDATGYVCSPTKENIPNAKLKKSAPSFFLTGEEEMDNACISQDEDGAHLSFSLKSKLPLRELPRQQRPGNPRESMKNKGTLLSQQAYEKNENNRIFRNLVDRKTKPNRSLFVDKYLSVKISKKKSSGYGQVISYAV